MAAHRAMLEIPRIRGVDLLWGALIPPAATGAAAAMLLASTLPPLVALTGFNRWDVFVWFGGAGAVLSLWLIALLPALPLAWLALRRGGLGWIATAICAAISTIALSLAAAWHAVGSSDAALFFTELVNWSWIWALATSGAMVSIRLGAVFSARRRAARGAAD